MGFLGRTRDLIRSCFAWQSGNNDDTQQIINDRVPPVDGTGVPDTGTVSIAPTSTDSLHMNSVLIRMLMERLDKLEQEKERHQRDRKKLESELVYIKAVLDKYQSQIESLRVGQIYFQEQYDRYHNVSYSPTYQSGEETMPVYSA